MNLSQKFRTLAFVLCLLPLAFTSCTEEPSSEKTKDKETSAIEGPITLRMALEEGTEYEQALEMDLTMELSMMGEEMVMEMNMEMNMESEVVSAEEAQFELEQTFTRMKMDMSGEGFNIDIDTDEEFDGPEQMRSAYDGIKGIIGKSVGVVFDERGKLQEIKGIEDLMEDGSGMALTGMNPTELLQGQSNFFAVFPEAEIKVGDTWEKEVSASNTGGSMFNTDMKMTYTLKEIKSEFAVIGVKIKIGLEPDAESGEEEPAYAAMMDISGEMKGTMEVNLESGMTHEMDMRLKMSMGEMGTASGKIGFTTD